MPATQHNTERDYPSLKELLKGQRFVKIGQFCQITQLSRSTVWRKVKSGELPPLIPLSDQIRAFKTEDVISFVERLESSVEVG